MIEQPAETKKARATISTWDDEPEENDQPFWVLEAAKNAVSLLLFDGTSSVNVDQELCAADLNRIVITREGDEMVARVEKVINQEIDAFLGENACNPETGVHAVPHVGCILR